MLLHARQIGILVSDAYSLLIGSSKIYKHKQSFQVTFRVQPEFERIILYAFILTIFSTDSLSIAYCIYSFSLLHPLAHHSHRHLQLQHPQQTGTKDNTQESFPSPPPKTP